jgi:hypothetical protein
VLANLQGHGTLAIAGGGNVVVGPDVAVTGLLAAEIEAQGAIALVEAAGSYSLHPVGASTGPQIMYDDTPVAASASRVWLPIGAEPLGDGYQVVWKLSGADQYVVWTVDDDGNWLSQGAVLSGAAPELRSLEPGFHQDLNGDGSIAHVTVIEAAGSTSLMQVAGVYLLPPDQESLGPQLTAGGSLIAAGQYGGSWALIGGERVGSGYEVAWKNVTADQYVIWNHDSNGAFVSNTLGTLSGSSLALQSAETTFHQDFNGDGTIGPFTTTIEASGSTSLVQVANTYSLHAIGGTTGPQVSFNGSPITAGQYGSSWALIGGEQVGGGYVMAWKTADQFVIWNHDSNGAFVSNTLGTLSGSSLALQSVETSFHQDLNGDGTVGPHTSVIEARGSTSLTQVADTYFLYAVGGATGPQLSFNGSPITAGQYGSSWALLGGEQVGSGYEVAWKSADQYVIWNHDSNGAFVSNTLGTLSGSSAALRSVETSFHQDLNGDGTIGNPPALLLADDPFR